MKPLARGIVIAVIHAALVLAVAGWFLYERNTLPRAWALTTGLDPSLPIRGRYVDLHLVIELHGTAPALQQARERRAGWTHPRVAGDKLVGDLLPDTQTDGGQHVRYLGEPGRWILAQSVAFFLSEHERDPTRLNDSEELWAEVTVPSRGAPRPIRLEVRAAPPRPDAAAAPG